MNINEIKNTIIASATKIRETKLAIKKAPSGSLEQSQAQSYLHHVRIQNRADYLAYGLARGQPLRTTESKGCLPRNDYESSLLSEAFWKSVSDIEGNALSKDSATQMLKAHMAN